MFKDAEKKMYLWERLNCLSDNVIEKLDNLLQVVEKESSHEVLGLLAMCDHDDVRRLIGAKGNISEAYTSLKQEVERKDIVSLLREYYIANPIEVSGDCTGVSAGIHYSVKADAENLRKDMMLNETSVIFSVPCTITLKYLDQQFTMQYVHMQSISKKLPRDIEALAKTLRGKIAYESVLWPHLGCKRDQLIDGTGRIWTNYCLDVISMLKDHAIGQQFMADTKASPHFELVFTQFGAQHLPLARELMSLHSDFYNESQEGDSITFRYTTGISRVFTQRDGVYYYMGRTC